MSKEQDLKYIKDFSKITISSVCEELNIDRSNILAGRASEKNTKAVKQKIIEKLNALEG